MKKLTTKLAKVEATIAKATAERDQLHEELSALLSEGEYVPSTATFDATRAASLLTRENKDLMKYLYDRQKANALVDLGVAAQSLYGIDTTMARNKVSQRLAYLQRHGLVRLVGDRWEVVEENLRAAKEAEQKAEGKGKKS